MPQIKIGVKLACLGLPFKKALPIVAEMGASAVEIDARGEMNPQNVSGTGFRQIRKWLDDFDLSVCAVGFQTRRGYDCLEDLQARIDATKRVMDFAYQLGTNVVVNQVGAIPESTDAPSWATLVDALTDLGNHSLRTGAFLAMKTGSEPGDRMKRLIDALPDGSVGVTFDPGNLIINGFSANDALETLATDIMYVHAKDGVQDLAQGRGIEVQLGRGSADFPTLLGTLEEAGYRGYFTVDRERSQAPIPEVATAVQYLSRM
ncbi:MAG: sugar phosphate isomerase/epimerase [Planctomycetales bacterium]|nr:sugar phosphate isomerase/epimerase [Planctomycetales bacterium]